jgi:hypothetical protein
LVLVTYRATIYAVARLLLSVKRHLARIAGTAQRANRALESIKVGAHSIIAIAISVASKEPGLSINLPRTGKSSTC